MKNGDEAFMAQIIHCLKKIKMIDQQIVVPSIWGTVHNRQSSG
jgi:hypothetical protein